MSDLNDRLVLECECAEDFFEVENLTREAFWGLNLGEADRLSEPGMPACTEHMMAHNLRKSDAFVPELCCVARLDGRIVGNIIYSKSRVVGEGGEHETLIFGPVSVLPEYQRMGAGSALIRHTLRLAKDMGYRAVIIYGHPAYYPRFGFVNAERYGIMTAEGTNFDAFMALELYEGALSGISGKYFYSPAFEVDMVELKEFDKRFPAKKNPFEAK